MCEEKITSTTESESELKQQLLARRRANWKFFVAGVCTTIGVLLLAHAGRNKYYAEKASAFDAGMFAGRVSAMASR